MGRADGRARAKQRDRFPSKRRMNKREMMELRELLERIDRLINEYMRASIPEHLAFLETEITAAKEKLQRIAASLIN